MIRRPPAGARTFGPATRSLLLLLLLTGACSNDAAGPDLPDTGEDGLRILFIGNSLTGTNDLPSRIRTVADVAGEDVRVRRSVVSGTSLEVQWSIGAREAVRDGWADVVVMQQGPSSTPENRRHLEEWVGRFADEIRAAGAVPAVYMVWPWCSRFAAFHDVMESYARAARTADALLIPGGEALYRAWSRDPSLPFFGADRFHPSALGSAVVALTAYRVLFGRPLGNLPATLTPTDPSLPVLRLPEASLEVILESVEEAVRAHAGASDVYPDEIPPPHACDGAGESG